MRSFHLPVSISANTALTKKRLSVPTAEPGSGMIPMPGLTIDLPAVRLYLRADECAGLLGLERIADAQRDRSSVSCRPAVSMRRSSTPPTVAFSSTVSRVVPAMSVTMARSKPTSAFKSELLPAFGAPMMAVATPFLSTFPRANVPRRSESVSSQHKSVRSVSSRERSSMSSSG